MIHSVNSLCSLIITAVYPLRDCDGTRGQKNDEVVSSECYVKERTTSAQQVSAFE